MPTFLLDHHHSAAHCATAFAAWRGFASPLRRGEAFSTCPLGGHRLWWFVEAPDAAAALQQLPEFVGTTTEVTRVAPVPIP